MFKKQQYEPQRITFTEYQTAAAMPLNSLHVPTEDEVRLIWNWFLLAEMTANEWHRLIQVIREVARNVERQVGDAFNAEFAGRKERFIQQGRDEIKQELAWGIEAERLEQDARLNDLKQELADAAIENEFLTRYIVQMELRDRGLVDTIEFLETDNEYLADALDIRDAQIEALVKKINKKGKKK